MNIKSKLLGLVVTGLVLSAALPTRADVGGVDMGITNQLVAGAATTTNLGNAVLIDKQDNCGFTLKFQGTNTTTGIIGAYFVRSGDGGVSYETSPGFYFSFAAAGTTAQVDYTNISNTYIGSCDHFKLLYLTNAGAADVTNVSLRVTKKTIKPSP